MKKSAVARQSMAGPGQGNEKVKSKTTEGKLGHFADEGHFTVD